MESDDTVFNVDSKFDENEKYVISNSGYNFVENNTFQLFFNY